MSNRYANLDSNLSSLQDLIKRDPASYREEFLEQYRHYENTLALFRLQPDLTDPWRLIESATFIGHVSHCYRTETRRLFDDVAELLRKNGPLLSADLRLALCKCVVMLRNKRLAPADRLLQLFFDLCEIKDKALRKYVFESTVSYVKNKKNLHTKEATALQALVFSRLGDSRPVVVRTALLICIDLYRRKIWQDAKTSNAIGRACFSRATKIFLAACKFFLGKDPFCGETSKSASESSDEEENPKNKKTLKQVMVGYRVGKKTRKRTKRMEKAKENLHKNEESNKKKNSSKKLKTLDFSALHYLYDPQEFAENLMKKLQKNADRFEAKLILMALIGRLIGVHKLQVLNFYPFMQKYLQPHQRDVTKMLLFAAQASHDLVPPDCIQSLVMTVVNNFVTDRASSEAITVGLNSVREIVSQCPLAIDEDLLQDLVEYKKYKNKNVSMAAKSLIQTFRRINPALLKSKDRGKPTEATRELKPATFYGESRAVSSIPGAECLVERRPATATPRSDGESDADDNSCSDYSSENDEDEEEVEEPDSDTNAGSSVVDCSTEQTKAGDSSVNVAETRILSQEEFRKMARFQANKQTAAASRKRKAREEEPNSDSDSDSEGRGEMATLKDIEHLHKRPKHSKPERMESVKRGREGREKFGRPKKKGPHVGRTNATLAKRKAFSMVKQKKKGKAKGRSFRDKQKRLRQYLLKQKKMR